MPFYVPAFRMLWKSAEKVSEGQKDQGKNCHAHPVSLGDLREIFNTLPPRRTCQCNVRAGLGLEDVWAMLSSEGWDGVGGVSEMQPGR